MTERFMVDDAGTLIDMQTRDMFDIVEEVCPLLNELAEENKQLKDTNTRCCNEYSYFHKQMMKLEKENEQIKHLINEAIQTERTELGRSVLRQLRDRIQ